MGFDRGRQFIDWREGGSVLRDKTHQKSSEVIRALADFIAPIRDLSVTEISIVITEISIVE